MIQRVQTIFLILMLILFGVAQYYLTVPGNLRYSIITNVSIYFILYPSFSAFFVLTVIFFFKKRKIQLLLNRIQLFFHFLVIIILSISFKFWNGLRTEDLWLLVPLFSILLLLLANRGIKKDENLIRALERIR